ncbi:VOC family protein [Ornithinibacillus sp. L9]|uniref:VOC family protein n=1 Tax=Ornithinibacillus caprae TaxID=2678566 RepID=A0A6N8FLW0_9BACI|nr:VOC family protein [Ornithinibacillus caprae]MUK90343.1 VOC family protein [Ornithinibacillus caprae]
MTVNITPYLMMGGNAREAIQYYQKSLGAEVMMLINYDDMPDPSTEHLHGLVAHAKLQIEESTIMISDSPSTTPIQQGNQVTISITTNDVEKSKRFFEALKDEGKVKMPFQQQSFSPGYGSLTDKFGVTFLFDTEI